MGLLRRRSIVYIAIAAMIVIAALTIKPLSIAYHRSWMQCYHHRFFEEGNAPQPSWLARLFRYEVQNWDRFEYHRERLKRWGALSSIDYSFQHIKLRSSEWKHFWKLIDSESCPPYDQYAGVSAPGSGEGLVHVQIWCAPEHRDEWMTFLKAVDVANYRERFMSPAPAQK